MLAVVMATRSVDVADGCGTLASSIQQPTYIGPGAGKVAAEASVSVPSRTEPGPVPTCSTARAPRRGPADPGPCAWHETTPSPRPWSETCASNAYLPAGSVALARTVVAASGLVPLISTGVVFLASKALGSPPASPLSPFTPGGPWKPRSPRGPRGPLRPRAGFDDFAARTTLVTVFWAAFPSGVVPSRATTSAAAARATARRCNAF